ncbi:MAG: 1-acyl-sn-glycerol-3-phosphate acyltransferase [Flavobacteriales bacterium]|nr:1-acyl-sn-glycerol-3-phosphate acyltransferase [Flavobacteriales bacterium]
MNFEDIRPYNDDEYQKIVKELFEVQPLMATIQRYLPELSFTEIKELLLSYNKIQDFQSKVVCRIITRILEHSANNFTYDGILKLDKKESYLLLSNHRDIVLDSALINYCLNDREYNTSEIAIGSNLLSEPWIKKLVRINKSFIVKRDIPKQEMLSSSQNLSAYIDYTLKEKRQSIWIAQREGRAKDGFDKTNPGLLKMFGMAAEGNLLDHLISLNITPVSLAYELNPCDKLQLPELLKKAAGDEYVKYKGEDEKSMLYGIQGNKGNVHIQFGSPINEEIKQFKDIKNRNELLKNIAGIIDQKIYKNYHLWNSNYVAYDMLHDTVKYEEKYDENGKEKFLDYMNERLSDFADNKEARNIFLLMYANPTINAEGIK